MDALNNMQNTLLQEALKYLKKKKSIIPINSQKKPYIKWQEYQNKLPTIEEVKTWWNLYPNANIGIITGKISGITVVDIDKGNPPAWLGAETTIVKTGGGGWHYYYKYKAS